RLEARHPALLREAQIVHTLWQAWHQQLQAEGWVEASAYYLQQLGTSLEYLPLRTHFYLAGFNRFTPAECEWLEQLAQRRPVHLLINGDPDDTGVQPRLGFLQTHAAGNPYTAFLQAALDNTAAPLLSRARTFAAAYPHSPVTERIHIHPAASFEHEIQLLTQAIQLALQQGERRIGIVTEDRKLARRLRAYLERSGIGLNDSVGWALSTTRAVALLENWLQCVENDFPYHAFLDLLKSSSTDDAEYLKLVYRFETDIVLHEKIANGMERYRRALKLRDERLSWWNNPQREKLIQLLDCYDQAALQFRTLLRKRAPARAFVAALLQSLQLLQLDHVFAADPAGQQVLALLERLQRSATALDAAIDWLGFRVWLGYALETHYFSPSADSQYVYLVNLQQSALQTFDTLIIAAADARHLPGAAGTLPFFNDTVRSALQLPDWRDRLAERQYMFRSLLENNRKIVISWQQETDSGPAALSPWLEMINHFHAAAYGRSLLAPVAIMAPAMADNNALPT
ncbi:MAG TPA: DNA helicase, partial [Gammaproteobacteria bacterium]